MYSVWNAPVSLCGELLMLPAWFLPVALRPTLFFTGGGGVGCSFRYHWVWKGPFLSLDCLTLTSSNRRNKLSHSPQPSGHFVLAMFSYGCAARDVEIRLVVEKPQKGPRVMCHSCSILGGGGWGVGNPCSLLVKSRKHESTDSFLSVLLLRLPFPGQYFLRIRPTAASPVSQEDHVGFMFSHFVIVPLNN